MGDNYYVLTPISYNMTNISNFCAHSNRFDFLEMFFFKRIYWRCSLKEAALVAM